MCGGVKEMRESVYGRGRGDFGVLQKPAWGVKRGDSSTERIKTVEGEGADKADGVDHNAS